MQNNFSDSVVIVAAQRTPVGSFLGALNSLPAPRLGALAIQAAVKQSGLSTDEIQECIMGQVLPAGSGQAPARQAAIYAQLPVSVACMTVNKVCGSGLKAVMLGADSIRLGHSQIVVAGGQESMSQSPFLVENARTGLRMGNQTLTDSMIKDGLWDPYNNWHMGNAAELCAREFQITREEQDQFSIGSYKKAQEAQAKNYFKNEIAAVEVPDKKGPIRFEKDEEPFKTQFDKIPLLKPVFDKAGTVTAANSSKINDGSAALVLMSESRAEKKGLKPLARIVGYSTFAQDPKWFTTAPVGAIQKVLDQTGKKISDIDLFEINEAFSNVTLAAQKKLQIPIEKINVHGGAIAIGHPIGASGARILTTLIYALQTHSKKTGLATLCIGGGEAVAMIIERA